VQENRADEVAKNRQARGSRNGNAVLTEAAAMEILSAYDAGEKQIDLAARHGVSPTAINLLVLGKTWKHVPKRKKGENGSAS
jgi:molybdenum-dependent DNA-binding transcriptional regulator ModE